MTIKSECGTCAGPIEYEVAHIGAIVPCPHCSSQITLVGVPQPPVIHAPVFHPARHETIQTARMITKYETVGSGCLVQGIGFLLLFLFPIGTIIGFALLFAGGLMARKIACSRCGNTLMDKKVVICSACQARFV